MSSNCHHSAPNRFAIVSASVYNKAMQPKILIVDDEVPIIDVLSYNLEKAHYQVIVAWDGNEALEKARSEKPDLIILDLLLPGLDGLDVCRILRREVQVPIIMLTALGTEVDRVVGLELGADDYVVKPFSVRELLARVKNVLRRANPTQGDDSDSIIRFGTLSLDPSRHEVQIGAVSLELTALEFDLLHALALNPGHVLSREKLLEQVWGYDYHGDLRVVDAAIKRLRAKLRQAAPQSEFVHTVRGVGYKFVA